MTIFFEEVMDGVKPFDGLKKLGAIGKLESIGDNWERHRKEHGIGHSSTSF